MKKFLIIAAIIIVLIAFVFLFGRLYFKEKNKNKELQKTNEVLKKNSAQLVDHANKIAEIEQEKSKTKIDRNSTDEEINNALNSVVSANNNRVQNNTEKK